MKKFYTIALLSIFFIFLTTYNPSEIKIYSNEKSSFFAIKNIIIKNNNKIQEDEIISKLSEIYEKNIFLIKTKDLKKPLESVFFLDNIEVKKRYPNTLILKIYETVPVAILLKNKEYFLLDSSSKLIPIKKNIIDYEYPHIFGEASEKHFLSFFKLLKENNFPIKRIKNYYYFQIGRWDIKLENNLLIKFPYNKNNIAIKKSIELLNRDDFNNYEVIDLRINDRIIVK